MTRTIAFAGRKGGTGKTTSTVNVAGWLASQGRRVLLVDADPQGNATMALGIEANGADVWRLLVRQDPLSDLLREARPGAGHPGGWRANGGGQRGVPKPFFGVRKAETIWLKRAFVV